MPIAPQGWGGGNPGMNTNWTGYNGMQGGYQQPQYRGYQGTQTWPQGNQQWNGYSQPAVRMPSYGGQQGMNGMQGQQGYSQGYMGQQGGDQMLCTVMGMEEAMNMPQAPGTMKPYFDVHKDLLYIKCVSADGVPSMAVYELHEVQEPMPQHGGNLIGKLMGNTSGQQVSREEFEQLKEMMMHGQSTGYMGQQGMEPSNAGTTPNAAQPGPQANGNASNQQRQSRS